MKILVLVAHPDDETIMSGGLISKRIKKGDKIRVCFFTKNQEAYFGKETTKDRAKRSIEEVKASAKILGFEHPKTGEFMRFTSETPDDMQQCIEKWRNYSKNPNN